MQLENQKYKNQNENVRIKNIIVRKTFFHLIKKIMQNIDFYTKLDLNNFMKTLMYLIN